MAKPKSKKRIVRQKPKLEKAKINKKGNPPAPPSRGGSVSFENFILLLFGFVLLGLVFLQLDTFKWLGLPVAFPIGHWKFLLELSLALVAVGFWLLPPAPARTDLPRWATYLSLGVVLGIGVFLRLYRVDEPFGFYWDDPAVCIIDPRNILDLHNFRMTYPIGLREPLFPYVAAVFWWFFPAMKPLIAQRIVSALFDLASLWVFYRVGRELSGKRRVGLLLAAFMAVSKPMIMQNLCGMGGLTLCLGIGFLLFTQIKIFKKPNLPHFLQWGLALAFAVYTYIAIRPWILFLGLVTLGWILWKRKEDRARWAVKIASGALGLLFALFFMDKLLFVLRDNPISRFWGGSLFLWIVLQVAFAALLIRLYRGSKGPGTQEKERQLTGWALGLLLAGLLIYPLAVNPEVSLKIRDLSLLPKHSSEFLSAQFFQKMDEQVTTTVADLFTGGNDRNDMNVIGDPFFELQGAVLALAGLVFAFIRPNWWKTFLVLCALVGILPHLLTVDPQSTKMLGALAPLLLLACMGLDRWMDGCFSGGWRSRLLGALLVLGVCVFWAWDGWGTYVRVYDKWWNQLCPDVQVYREVKKDINDKRVYLASYHGMGFLSTAVQGVLFDGQPLYDFKNQNVIEVGADEKRKDVMVIVASMDGDLIARLKKEFPKAQWLPAWMYYQNSATDKPYFFRVEIPSDQIPEKPGKTFMFRVVPGKNWLRRVYVTYFGLGKGMIQWESLGPALNPVPPDSGAHSASADGDWEAPSEGDYTFSVNTPDVMQIWVDGKKVVDSKPTNVLRTVSGTIHLTKGNHSIHCVAFLNIYPYFADVNVRNRAAGLDQVLGK